MNNSDKFKSKLITTKIAYVVMALIVAYVLKKVIYLGLKSLIDERIILPIYVVLVIFVVIIMVYYLLKNNSFSEEEKNIICDELDNKIDKVFNKYGLYITENYIVCIGGMLSFFKLFVIPIKEIDAIDTHSDDRFFYKKRGKKTKHKFLSFLSASVKNNLVYGDNDRAVFNIICGKKVFYVASSSYFNKIKIKEIDEIADYICNKYKDIDYL
jgi:hypothetical protein